MTVKCCAHFTSGIWPQSQVAIGSLPRIPVSSTSGEFTRPVASVAQILRRDASNVEDTGDPESPRGCRECHFAALAQLPEALRSGRRSWGGNPSRGTNLLALRQQPT